MSQPPSSFLNQWLSIQIFGAIALAVVTQAIVTLLTLLFQIDNLPAIYLMRLLGCLISNAIQGYLQWQLLKQVIKSLDRKWMYTAIARLPIDILTWGLIHLLDRIGFYLTSHVWFNCWRYEPRCV